MLTVEKKKRGGEVSIAFKTREGFFSKTLKKAFLWALGLHFAAVLFFHIAPFRLTSDRILPPAFVESDPLEAEGGVAASFESEWSLRRYLLSPRLSEPEIPTIAKPMLLGSREFGKEKLSNEASFANLEKAKRENGLFEIKNAKETSALSLRVFLSGPLAERQVSELNPPKELLTAREGGGDSYIYHVRVDDRLGEIFWYEPLNPRSRGPLTKEDVHRKMKIEDFLKNLKFEKNVEGFVTSGDVEIVFEGVK